MPGEPLRCDPGRIEQFVEGRLTNVEQSEFESHLETCGTCRERLETTAAEQSYWTEAAAYLPDDALDAEPEAGLRTGLSDADGLGPGERLNVLRIADYFDPTDDPRMLGRFGGYEIVGIIGCGGMGVVLKGFEAALDRYVAVKLLAPHLATSGAARTRFAREARAAAAVLHENVVAIHRVSQSKGLPYLVMPYVPGDSLQKRLDERGPLELKEILRIGMQVAAGLAAAHAQGIVHRDITPGNILLDNGVERVTLTDFGLARAADDASLTRSGVIAGTPQYMSPEQARSEPLDGRSDLFSLGSVLYAMCAGRPPFRAETTFGVLQRIRESAPSPIRNVSPEMPEWLLEIIARLHAKAPGERFQSARDVADLLGRWLAHLQQPTVIPAPVRTSDRRRRAKRLWRIVAAFGIVIAGVCLTVVRFYWPSGNITTGPEPRIAEPDRTADATGDSHADVSIGPLLDERALDEDCRTMRQRMSQIERGWSESSPPGGGDGWESTVSDLQRRMDDLRQRIDRATP
ncbi:MAG: protein kinase domain-containing protein [Thermoguttaceae bacterium]